MILANRFYPRRGCYYKSLLFYVQKMNTSLLNMEQYKPASAISLEESDEPVESKKDAK